MYSTQQSFLQKLLTQQDDIWKEWKEKHTDLSHRLSLMEDKIHNSPYSSNCSQTERKEVKVTRELTKKVITIHDQLDEGFKPDESLKFAHNKNINEKIIGETLLPHSDKYSEEDITVAVKRKYESLRRHYLDEEKENFEEIHASKGKLKSIGREKDGYKFDSRALVVLSNEMNHWKQISVDFMTEESDDSDDPNVLVIHELTCRSRKLMEFLHTLDKSYKMTVRKDGMKSRKVGTPSNSLPPFNAPQWTITASKS